MYSRLQGCSQPLTPFRLWSATLQTLFGRRWIRGWDSWLAGQARCAASSNSSPPEPEPPWWKVISTIESGQRHSWNFDSVYITSKCQFHFPNSQYKTCNKCICAPSELEFITVLYLSKSPYLQHPFFWVPFYCSIRPYGWCRRSKWQRWLQGWLCAQLHTWWSLAWSPPELRAGQLVWAWHDWWRRDQICRRRVHQQSYQVGLPPCKGCRGFLATGWGIASEFLSAKINSWVAATTLILHVFPRHWNCHTSNESDRKVYLIRFVADQVIFSYQSLCEGCSVIDKILTLLQGQVWPKTLTVTVYVWDRNWMHE